MNHVAQEIRENPGVVLMAGFGAGKGLYEVFIKEHLTAKRAWGAMALSIVAYELACPPGQTLSEGADRALEAHRLLTLGVIGLTALHLSNALPPQLDPLHQALTLFKQRGGVHAPEF